MNSINKKHEKNHIKAHHKKQLHKTNHEDKILKTVIRDNLCTEDKNDILFLLENSNKKRVAQILKALKEFYTQKKKKV